MTVNKTKYIKCNDERIAAAKNLANSDCTPKHISRATTRSALNPHKDSCKVIQRLVCSKLQKKSAESMQIRLEEKYKKFKE